MNIRHLIFLGLMITSFTWANNYLIKPENISKSDSFNPKMKTYIEANSEFGYKHLDSISDISSGGLYIRYKNANKSYSFYQGKPSFDSPKKLYVFDPQDIGLSVSQIILHKMYGKNRQKAFRDEQEIYFDKNYLYSSRVKTIYFKDNKGWSSLQAKPHLGLVKFSSSTDSVTIQYSPNGSAQAPYSILKDPGLVLVKYVKREYFDKIVGYKISRGLSENKVDSLIKSDSINYRLFYPVSYELIDSTNTLYDLDMISTHIKEDINTLIAFKKRAIQKFEKQYYTYDVNLKNNEVYKNNFDQVKAQALEEYLDTLLIIEEELKHKIMLITKKNDSLSKQSYSIIVKPNKVEYKKIAFVDSTSAIYKFRFRFGGVNQPHSVYWIGELELDTFTVQSFVESFQNDSLKEYRKLQVQFLGYRADYINKQGKVIPKYYRYKSISFDVNGKVDTLEGKFILPPFVEDLKEVKAWRATQKIPLDTLEEDSINVPYLDTLGEIAEKQRLLDSLRGRTVEIPEGFFRYKKKKIAMSSFFINETEITQSHYNNIMKLPNSSNQDDSLPKTHLTYYQAEKFCKDIGGELPTEAQWEYAARAGSINGFITHKDSISQYGHYSLPKNKKKKPTKVAQHKANEWGMYDVIGNVSEWTKDRRSIFKSTYGTTNPSGSKRGHSIIVKGSSWKSSEDDHYLEDRDWEDPRYWGPEIGFRCVFLKSPSHN